MALSFDFLLSINRIVTESTLGNQVAIGWPLDGSVAYRRVNSFRADLNLEIFNIYILHIYIFILFTIIHLILNEFNIKSIILMNSYLYLI